MKAVLSLKGSHFVWEVENGKYLLFEAPVGTIEIISVIEFDSENGIVFVFLKGKNLAGEEKIVRFPIDIDRIVAELWQDCEEYYECVTNVELG